jgi:hypothetical protein
MAHVDPSTRNDPFAICPDVQTLEKIVIDDVFGVKMAERVDKHS